MPTHLHNCSVRKGLVEFAFHNREIKAQQSKGTCPRSHGQYRAAEPGFGSNRWLQKPFTITPLFHPHREGAQLCVQLCAGRRDVQGVCVRVSVCVPAHGVGGGGGP